MKKVLIILTAVALPYPVLAQPTIQSILTDFVGGLLRMLIPILLALGLVYFLFGLAQAIKNSGSKDGAEEAKSRMLWGALILFFMASIWGWVNVIGESLGVTRGGGITPPCLVRC